MESKTFEKKLMDKTSGIACDFYEHSNVLLVAFGGIAGELGMPPFEFLRMTRELKVNKVFIRDLMQVWYQSGVPGIGTTIDDIEEKIRNIKETSSSKKLVMIGNSAGGYAAILLGNKLNADSVHAFSPQTFINKKKRFLNLDFRWSRQIYNMYKSGKTISPCFDLKEYLTEAINTKTEFNIYYCSRHRLDRAHAMNLSGLKNVVFHDYANGGHNVIKNLKKNGKLKKILEKSVAID